MAHSTTARALLAAATVAAVAGSGPVEMALAAEEAATLVVAVAGKTRLVKVVAVAAAASARLARCSRMASEAATAW
jgi:hypothetical protein